MIKDCLDLAQQRRNNTRHIPTLVRFCVDCRIKHLIMDYPLNPEVAKKIALNFVEVQASMSGTDSDHIALVQIVTRTHAQRNAKV